MLIYARAITEILQMGGDINDGALVMSHIFNRSYHSIQGFDVSNQEKKIIRKKEGFLVNYRNSIFKIIINTNFYQVFIDSNGDAEGNYTVITLQSDTNAGPGNSLAKMSMQPVGFFVYNKDSVIPVS